MITYDITSEHTGEILVTANVSLCDVRFPLKYTDESRVIAEVIVPFIKVLEKTRKRVHYCLSFTPFEWIILEEITLEELATLKTLTTRYRLARDLDLANDMVEGAIDD